MNEKQLSPQDMDNEIKHKMSQWRQANPKATLTEIEEAVDEELGKLRGHLVAMMAQTREDPAGEAPTCAACGQEMVRNGRKKRKLKAKEGRTLELERQQWRCLGCGATLFPPG